MAGLHGCLPNVCYSHDSYNEAVDDMASMHELGRDRKRKLKRCGYLELNCRRDGNEYIEIVSCSCDNPENHNF